MRTKVGGQSGKSQKLLVGGKHFLSCVDIDFFQPYSGVKRLYISVFFLGCTR